MTVKRTPLQLVRESRAIAQEYNLLIVEKGSYFHIFRKMPTCNVHVGRTSSAVSLRRAVCRITGFK